MKSLQSFLNDLGARESGGNYKSINKYGYIGKYQMGESAMEDAGYYKKPSKKYNNDWTGVFTGKDGIYSVSDYLASQIAQENSQIIFKKCQWKYLNAVGADKYVGQIINNYKITESGLLAGAHLKGAGAVIKYLKSNGNINPTDSFGTTLESYIKNFGDYDVKKITEI
ncbi:MAG: hypothetical protein MJ237_07470 [bacterium]|nr:hypothetical protein [bacterium]